MDRGRRFVGLGGCRLAPGECYMLLFAHIISIEQFYAIQTWKWLLDNINAGDIFYLLTLPGSMAVGSVGIMSWKETKAENS